MKLLLSGLLIILLPVAAQGENTSVYCADDTESTGDLNGNSSISDILFIQYRGIFRDLLGRRCVYYPSCSHYGQEVIESHGVVFGFMMAFERWTRCTSAAFSHGDYRITEENRLADPVSPGEDVVCWGRFLLPF